jgi:hypothetical protein
MGIQAETHTALRSAELEALHQIADLGTCGGKGGFQKAIDIAVAAICAAAPSALSADWNFDIRAAPKDGTLLLLLIEAREHALDDTAWLSRSVGFNNFAHDGEDVWKFAGWC